MYKKKVFSLMLAGMLSASMLAGCAENAASSDETAAAEESAETEESTAQETAAENAEAGETDASEADEEITLETIAELNGVDVSELNTVFDEDGNLSFLGDKISEDIIQDEDDAYTFVTEKMSSLLHLEDVSLTDGDSYTSPHTGITYYRFNQTLPAEIEAKMPDGTFGTLRTDMEYLTNSLKLGVDSNGSPVVLASDISYDEVELDGDSILSPEDAEAVVAAAHPDLHIYSDATSITLWKDNSASTISKAAAAAVVYLVYADNPDFEEDPTCTPYICCEVRADGEVDYNSNGIIAELAADSLSTYSYTTIDNTSLVYFDDMEDVGEYTYTVNFDWMNEEDRAAAEAYVGKDSMEITVPVMRCKTDGLYYLGWKEHNIFMSNALDFYQSKGDWAKLNGYVTDDPEDLSSWHFESAENTELSCTYADDPNYVLASFAEYVKVIDTFGENFGMYESYPSDSFILLTYSYDPQEMMTGSSYPTELTGFMRNACNGGSMYDWTTFLTSPNLGLCLDDVVMCHEFTHGVNQHFTNSQYANEQGAVMEAMADMVGYQMASVYLDPQLAEMDDWYIGGTYGPIFRNLSNPLSMNYPEYKGGLYYVNSVDQTIISSDYVDNGGVHENSLIPSFLGTKIVNGTPETGEETLTVEESLQMWFEVLYISNYSTDFVNLGADLKYAAKALELSEEKQTYLNNLIHKYGFADGTVDPELLNSENGNTITITLEYEDPELGEKYFFCDLFMNLLERKQLVCGGFTDNAEQIIRITKDVDYPQYIIFAQGEKEIQERTAYQGYMNVGDLGEQVTFHVKKADVPAGEAFTLEKSETFANLTTLVAEGYGEYPLEDYQVKTDDSTGITSISAETPALKIIMTKEDGFAEGEYNLYLVSFE